MRAVVAIAMVIGLGTAAGVRADEHAPMRAAEQELKIARDHLQGADRDYAGHRRNALEHVNEALREIRLALQRPKSEPDTKSEPGAKHDGADAADD